MIKASVRQRAYLLFELNDPVSVVASELEISRFMVYRLRAKWLSARTNKTDEIDAVQAAVTILLEREHVLKLVRKMGELKFTVRGAVKLALLC
jgi:hypothetical protein